MTALTPNKLRGSRILQSKGDLDNVRALVWKLVEPSSTRKKAKITKRTQLSLLVLAS